MSFLAWLLSLFHLGDAPPAAPTPAPAALVAPAFALPTGAIPAQPPAYVAPAPGGGGGVDVLKIAGTAAIATATKAAVGAGLGALGLTGSGGAAAAVSSAAPIAGAALPVAFITGGIFAPAATDAAFTEVSNQLDKIFGPGGVTADSLESNRLAALNRARVLPWARIVQGYKQTGIGTVDTSQVVDYAMIDPVVRANASEAQIRSYLSLLYGLNTGGLREGPALLEK